jgi:hypothetical protein
VLKLTQARGTLDLPIYLALIALVLLLGMETFSAGAGWTGASHALALAATIWAVAAGLLAFLGGLIGAYRRRQPHDDL